MNAYVKMQILVPEVWEGICDSSFLPSFLSFPSFFSFLRPLSQHMEVESELQLPAYTTATAMWDLSRVCDLHYSSRQHQILNPLSEARDQIFIFMDTSWIHFRCTAWEPPSAFLISLGVMLAYGLFEQQRLRGLDDLHRSSASSCSAPKDESILVFWSITRYSFGQLHTLSPSDSCTQMKLMLTTTPSS